jgi:peptidoglycan/xylan/chitin deacetylase (PgdA/CDA1 family)
VPTVVGVLRPFVLVPASALTGLTPQQLEAVLAHELAHVRRHDYLVNLLQSLAEAALFYHPAARWASRHVRREREHACDDLAAAATRGGPVAYARALARLEQLRAEGTTDVRPALAADGGGELLARIRRLVRTQQPARPSARLAPAFAAALLLAAAFGALAGAQNYTPGASSSAPSRGEGRQSRDRRIAVTFVGLPTFRASRDSVETLRATTKKLLADMAENKITAVGFVGEGMLGDADPRVREARLDTLRAWLDAGHELGNQSYAHKDLYTVPLEEWEESVVRGEEVTRRLLEARGRRLRYFSYPYLNTGPDPETKRAAAEFLRGRGYAVHHVTVDSTEWLFATVHQEALRRGDAETQRRVAAEYVPYMERMVEFYEGLSRDVFGREIPQVLMLTTSPVVADQFDELVAMLKRRGYRFVTLDEALADEAYAQPETYTGEWGVSWLQRWNYTKTGKFRAEPTLPPYMRQFGRRDGALSETTK